MRDDIITSVDRALEILLALYNSGEEMGISEISDALHIYKSIVFWTLKTLEKRGFVRQNPENGKYWIGIKLYAISALAREKMSLKNIVAPYARKLFDECKESVNVSVLEVVPGDFHRSLIIYKEYSRQNILMVNQPLGSSNLCYCSSVGKCLLAFSRDVDLSIYEKKAMYRFTDNTLVDPKELLEQIERVRIEGYALDREEMEEGLACIGVPIRNREGYALAAISISGPTPRILNGGLESKIERVRATARDIEKLFV